MNVHISLMGVVLLLSLGLFLAVGLLKLIAAAGNALVGRSSESASSGGFFATLLKVGLVGGMLVLVAGGLFLHRSQVSVSRSHARSHAVDEISVEIQDGALEMTRELRDGLRELDDAREEVRDAIRESGMIQIEIGDDSTDAADESSAEAEGDASGGGHRGHSAEESASSEGTSAESHEAATSDSESESDAEVNEDTDAAEHVPAEKSDNADTLAADAGDTADQNDDRDASESDQSESDPSGSGVDGVTQSGNVVVFQLSDGSVERLLGANGRAWLREFHDKLPEELHDSYALIPLTATVGTTAPAAVRPFAAADRIQSVLTAVASMLPDASLSTADQELTGSQSDQVAEADDSSQNADTFVLPRHPPTWLEQPGKNQFLVETEFAPQSESTNTEEELRVAINRALTSHMIELTKDDRDVNPRWYRTVNLLLAHNAAEACIVDQYAVLEVLKTDFGPEIMEKTVALVEFPAGIQQNALRAVEDASQMHRTSVVGLMVAMCWMGLVLSSVSFRLFRRKSRLVRYILAPVILLAGAGLGAGGVGVVGATTVGEVVLTPLDELNEVVVQLDTHDQRH